MDWITRELTAVEKVRRNVMLLSALACLVAFFPVRADEVSLLGAKFESDVVAFALFHALMFYTATLCVRTLIFRQLTAHGIEDFSEEIEGKIEATARTENAHWKEQIDDAAHAVRKQEAEIAELDSQLAAAQSALLMAEDAAKKTKRLGTTETARLIADVTSCSDRVEACTFERERAEAGLQGLRILVHRVEDSARTAAAQRRMRLTARGPTAQMLAIYVFLGEYLLPIAFGIGAAVLLQRSQAFPMLWEISLITDFFSAQTSET